MSLGEQLGNRPEQQNLQSEAEDKYRPLEGVFLSNLLNTKNNSKFKQGDRNLSDSKGILGAERLLPGVRMSNPSDYQILNKKIVSRVEI